MFGDLYPTNPRLALDPGSDDMVMLFGFYHRDAGGYLPESGAVLDQAAIMLDCFAIMAGALAELRAEREENG